MAHIYRFALVRVCPDPRRGELLNIGVVVFLRSSLDVRILPSLSKVQALHGELDLSELFTLPDKLNSLSPKRAGVAERHRLLEKVGMVELSPLGQFSATGNDEYEEVIEGLITKLVKPTTSPRPTERRPFDKLQIQVRKIIKEARLLGRRAEDLEKHKVISHFPISPEKGLYADFAGKNSLYHFTETIDYRVDRGIMGSKFNESAKAALVLREAQSHFQNSTRIVFYAATPRVEIEVRPHLNLLREFATDFLNFQSAQDRARYVQALSTALGGALPLN